MDKKRRQIVQAGLKLGALAPIFGSLPSFARPHFPDAHMNTRKLNILILGGTSFLGPHQIAAALEHGHHVSTFTRGKTTPTVHADLLDKVEALIGDRENDLSALKNRKWDAVIDNSGRKVEWTKASAELLRDHVDLYLYTSSTGVYYPYLGKDIREDAELVLDVPEGIEGTEMELEYGYGVMKANSEIAAKEAFGEDRAIIVRPTYMVGPGDRSNRFIHWPVRLGRGGEVLVPGKKHDPVQWMDVRDVGTFMIDLIEKRKAGTFNATGPKKATGMHAFVNEARKAFDVDHHLVFIDDYDFLKLQNVYYIVPWIMPEGNNAGSALVSNQQAVANGLRFTPIRKTMLDTHGWWYSDALSDEYRRQFEGDPKGILMREAGIIGEWRNRG